VLLDPADRLEPDARSLEGLDGSISDTLLARGPEQTGVSTLWPLLLLQLLFLAAFLWVCVVWGPWHDADAILAVIAGMFGVAAMANICASELRSVRFSDREHGLVRLGKTGRAKRWHSL
jgi:hypothetical protein